MVFSSSYAAKNAGKGVVRYEEGYNAAFSIEPVGNEAHKLKVGFKMFMNLNPYTKLL